MDTHYLGSVLLSLTASRSGHPISTQEQEDAYYAQHDAAPRRVPRLAPVIILICVAVVAIGLSA